jgi:hypothetical protein
MTLHRYILRVLGWPCGFDIEAVTSVLKGRRQPRQRAMFRGFNSPQGRF